MTSNGHFTSSPILHKYTATSQLYHNCFIPKMNIFAIVYVCPPPPGLDMPLYKASWDNPRIAKELGQEMLDFVIGWLLSKQTGL